MSEIPANFKLFKQKREEILNTAKNNLNSNKTSMSNLKYQISDDSKSKYFPTEHERKMLLNELYSYFL